MNLLYIIMLEISMRIIFLDVNIIFVLELSIIYLVFYII